MITLLMSKKANEPKTTGKKETLVPKGILIAIGGKEDKGLDEENEKKRNENFIQMEILERFCQELKGKNPLVAVIPTASSVPEEAGQDYVDAFGKLGRSNVKLIDIRERADVTNPEYLDLVRKADGVMFTGGDQLRLTAILGGSEFLLILKQRYIQEQIVIAGTSAGAAAMSAGMIYEGQELQGMLKGDVKLTTGLDFLKNVAIDTHFITRGRMVRMAHLLATNPGCIGIGLEEDTGIVVKGGKEAEVIGSGLIVIMDARGCTSTNIHEANNGEPVTIRNMVVHLLGKGDCFNLPEFNPLYTY
ncbi:cyanophycinase [Adhaeribacter aquaticus]|uniref:cyanophycinase n=1 Tax=Adhaeribacter aquaticus TaxID=299567 RepID=UPI001FDECA5B|nr:cyanophycinase [Adhaeribacter aquaticus]